MFLCISSSILIIAVLITIFLFREAKEKKDAQERYWKLHEQGKTDQAKADMSRLAKIRAEREAAAAKRKAETEGMSCFLTLCHPLFFIVASFERLTRSFADSCATAKTAEIETKKKAEREKRRI